MFGHQFYHESIRRYIIMFGNMFNDIDIIRYNDNKEISRIIRVPIAYGPRDKFLSRIDTDPNLDRQIAIQLPRLAFEMTNISYDSTRALNKLTRNINLGESDDKLRGQYTPVPYNIDITLNAMFRYNEDAVQCMEQILPFFRPEWTNSIKLVDSIGDYYDIPTVLNSISIEDNYDSGFEDRRTIIHRMDFTIKGYIFGPITNKGVITRTIVNYKSDTPTTTATSERDTLVPGLLANGQPTTDSSLSISRDTISANSDYGFAFDKENFFTGIE